MYHENWLSLMSCVNIDLQPYISGKIHATKKNVSSVCYKGKLTADSIEVDYQSQHIPENFSMSNFLNDACTACSMYW